MVSSSETWSPLESDTDHNSSSATTEELEICKRLSWKSSIDIPSWFATSASVGVRPNSRSSFDCAVSISRALARTERGTQSSERSSSIIEPLMRATANVSNLISRLGSKRSIAPMSPSSP
jgi:hypothetical protein